MKYGTIFGVLLIALSVAAYAGLDLGQSCATGAECNSGYCAGGTCCSAGQCGYNSTCYDINQSYFSGSGLNAIEYVCTEGGWKLGYAEGCQTNDSCVTGKCLNGVCCNANECGWRFMAYGCYAVGQNTKDDVCVSEGVLKLRNEKKCVNDSECASNNCADTVCCNADQCGYNNTCYEVNASYATGYGPGIIEYICTDEKTWKRAYADACTMNQECITGKCINSVCCNANECGARFAGTGCYKAGENFMSSVCVSEGLYKTRENHSCAGDSECASNSCVNNLCTAYTPTNYPMNHSCNLSWECASNSCADNVCCDAGQCGLNNRCYALNQTYQSSMNNKKICTDQGWKLDYRASCTDNESCVTGKCINGACCNTNQCAASYMSPLFCTDVGEVVQFGRYIARICFSEGVWKTSNEYPCSNNSDCTSNNCAEGVCCNIDQCSWNNRCWNQSQTYQTGMNNKKICTSQGWKNDYRASCTDNESCVTGRCINGACCNQNQCAMAYMSPLFCKDVGESVRLSASQNKTCIAEGVWETKIYNGYSCTENSDCFSNYCVNNTCTESLCQNLWWFDNTTRVCGLKEFCGEYTYYGLQTFQNQSECLKELTGEGCIGEGDHTIIYPGAAQCCAGLATINPAGPDVNGTCGPPSEGASICAYCGNGVCGIGENKCNCPEDCPEQNQTCAAEGEIPQWIITTPNGSGGYYKDCCANLTKVLDWGYDSDCNKTRSWANAVCVKECGDGACTTGETKCNCPADCNTTTSTTSTSTTSTTTSTTQQACPNGVDIHALGTGADAPVMQLWINGRMRAQWKTIDYAKHFVYETEFVCGENEVTIVYANGTGNLNVYGVKIGCDEFPAATLATPQALSIDYYKNCGACNRTGDYPPCGEISLEEIIGLIQSWSTGGASLVDVIELIEEWKNA